MSRKLFAFLLGLLLLFAGYYFQGSRPSSTSAVNAEEEDQDQAPRGRPLNPAARPPVYQTASYHPSGIQPSESAELPPLRTQEAVEHWNAVASLVNCATSRVDCNVPDLPDTDPSSRFFSVRDRILDELDWFMAHRTNGPEQSARMVQAAHFLLSVPDEQIQARALDQLLREPPSAESPEIIAKTMPDVVDTESVQKIAQVLKRSLSDANVRTVTEYVCNTILYGATLSSKEMAKQAALILTEHTRGPLEACLTKLPKGERYHSMRNALYPSTAI